MRKRLALIILFLVFPLVACDLSSLAPIGTAQPAPDLVQTYVVQTVEALGSQVPTNTPPTDSPVPTVPPEPTLTLEPTSSPTVATPTLTMTATQPIPTVTHTPTQTPTNAIPCDRVGKVTDITIPDGTIEAPGATFTKTWEITNAGSCTWDSGYMLVFGSKGDAMSGPASKQLTTGTIAPNQKVQISVSLTAPAKTGTYRGYWKLRNAAGVVFGIGQAETSFWVEITVASPEYNFVKNYCKATWKSSATSSKLSCPGKSSDTKGFVIKEDEAVFGMHTDDESGLWTNPPISDDSQIKGTFPAIPVTSNSRFRAFIGCRAGATHCNVKFKVAYKADGGSEKTLGSWSADVDTFTEIDVNLDSLAGKSVQFVLIVNSNGSSDQDQALWLQPRIASD